MQFRKNFVFDRHAVNSESDIPQEIALTDKTNVSLFKRKIENGIEQFCFDIKIKKQISKSIAECLNLIKKREIHTEIRNQLDFNNYFTAEKFDKAGRVREGYVIPIEWTPQSFRDFYKELLDETHAIARKFTGLLRWEQRSSGTHRIFSSTGLGHQFSNDGLEWTTLPSSHNISVFTTKGININKETLDRATNLFKSGTFEPFAHELLREARGVEHASIKSALLISIMALETGTKNYLSHLIKNSEIFIEKFQSPPVITMIQEVIPELHRKLDIQNSDFPLNKIESDTIKARIYERNRIAHGLEVKIKADKIDNLIILISKILYNYDFLCGQIWAKKFINLDNFEGRVHLG